MATDDESSVDELMELNERLLDSIVRADWDAYAALCDPTITAFEPESMGTLVEGMEFHRYYFNLGASKNPVNTTMAAPHVRLLGDVAIVSYVRLVQKLAADGSPVTARSQETRVWHRDDSGAWRHVHFHRTVG